MYGTVFAGRMDCNQPTGEISVFHVQLEGQSHIKQRINRIIWPGTLISRPVEGSPLFVSLLALWTIPYPSRSR